MHPVLAQDTIRDLSHRHHRTIEATEQRVHLSRQESEPALARPERRGARAGLGAAFTLIMTLPKRWSLSHS